MAPEDASTDDDRRSAPVRSPAAPVVPAGTPTGVLGDVELADEIELYGAVVVAASEKEGELTPAEIDDALGVDEAAERGGHGPPGVHGDGDPLL